MSAAKFKARWKHNQEEFNCQREGDLIAFGRGDEEKWRKLPLDEFPKYLGEVDDEKPTVERQGLFA